MNDVNTKTGAQTVRSRSYLASLPERTARARAALAGGLVCEATEVVLPDAVRRSKFYQALGGSALARGAKNDTADRSIGRRKCRP